MHPGQHRVGATAVQPPGCSLHDRILVPSYRISSRWLSTRSGSCWRPYHARHRRWTFCLSLYWRTARKSSRRPSPHLPTCHCRPESSQHASNQCRCCRYWKRRGSTGRCQSTTLPDYVARQLTYRQSPKCSRDLCWHVCVPTSPTPRTSASGSRPAGKDIRPRRRCSMSLTVSTLRRTARIILLIGLDLSATFGLSTILDSVASTGPNTVGKAWAASVFWNHPGSRSTIGIGTRSTAVRRVLQSSRWRHRAPWRPMPSTRPWHSVPSSDARRQHSCRPVHSRRLYHWQWYM